VEQPPKEAKPVEVAPPQEQTKLDAQKPIEPKVSELAQDEIKVDEAPQQADIAKPADNIDEEVQMLAEDALKAAISHAMKANGHPTEVGHQVIAEGVADNLKDLGYRLSVEDKATISASLDEMFMDEVITYETKPQVCATKLLRKVKEENVTIERIAPPKQNEVESPSVSRPRM